MLAAIAFGSVPANGDIADTIYAGGPVLTMDDAGTVAEAVAVRDGRIVAVGGTEAILQLRGESTRLIDLAGRPLLPGFVDSHGHAFGIGLQAVTANLLPPPDGGVASMDDLIDALTQWQAAHPDRVERVGWIAGFGYDDAQFAEGRHPVAQDLDRVSNDLAVVVIHQSGHMGTINSVAMQLVGLDADSEEIPGGTIARDADGTPTGFLQENAFFGVLASLAGTFDDDVNHALVLEGTQMLASYGYTTGQEGRAMGDTLDAMRAVGGAGGLPIDVVVYPDILTNPVIEPRRDYEHRVRVGGAKLTIDGSPQGKTAWLTEPYFVVPDGQDASYAGFPAITRERAMEAIETAYAKGWQILVHANGDAAIDLMLDAVAAAQSSHPNAQDLRPVLIHGQTLRRDQVDRLDELGVFPSLFPMHTFYWGDFHRESVLGPQRAEHISPTGWVLERGMRFATHHDAPVALPDSMRILSATVTRRTRSGDILGPQHRVDVMTALKAMTIWPAWQHFEEDAKGSIEAGKLADFVILSDDPRTVEPGALADLRVAMTIKEDRVIYEAQAADDAIAGQRGAFARPPALAVPPAAQRLRTTIPVHTDRGIGRFLIARRPGVCSADGCFNHAAAAFLAGLTGVNDERQ